MDILAPILSDNKLPEYIDFKTLRKEGIEHIAAFSGKLWTDHNVHDPGITILEALCYVLTDLDYRTKLDFKDLVTKKEEGAAASNFFTAAQILGNNPLTIMDYRKLLIDITGVRNAWLEPINPVVAQSVCNGEKSNDPGYSLSYDCESKKISNQYFPGNNLSVPLHGLYKVLIEPDDIYPSAFEKNACGNSEFNYDDVIGEIGRRLAAHRNLCEDFADITLMTKEPVSFCLHVELKPDADPEDVLTNIFKTVQEFFSPAPGFYTLKQMLDKGKTMDEIFEGRPMDFNSVIPEPAQKNGFIDTEELQNIARHTVIYTSDLYRIIMGIEGVEGVTRLVLFSHAQPAITLKGGEEWMLKLLVDHRPVLLPENCNVIFFKNKLPFSINSKKARQRYLKGLADFHKSRKKEDELNQPVPKGRTLDLAQYQSVQYEFPRVYYIGKNGVPTDAPPERKVQSLQLQGYLLFYDRLLADYFAQLSGITGLFSLQKNTGPSHTYFAGGLDDIPMLPSLLRGFQKQPGYGSGQDIYNGMKLAFEPSGNNGWDGDAGKHVYQTFYSRDEGMQRLMNACTNASLHPLVKKNDEKRFYFVLQDANNTIFLQSYLYFDTEIDALRAANDVLFMGGLPSGYQRNNDRENGEFSFDLIYSSTNNNEYINALNEPANVFFERKEKFLNHLLARFSEDFTDYSLMMYALNGKKNGPERIIEDKQNFLSEYADISANRGKAFDYSVPAKKFPVSGLQKRVSSLMGIHPYPSSSLNNFDIIPLYDKWIFRFFFPGEKDSTPFFESVSSYNSEEEAHSAYQLFLKLAANANSYKDFGCGDEKVYGFRVQAPPKNEIWLTVQCTLTFTNTDERDEMKHWFYGYIKADGKYTAEILSRKGSYFLFVKDQDKPSHDINNLLLKSIEGYAAELDAWEALYNCYRLTQIDEAWKIVNAHNSSREIITISDPAVEPTTVLARYPLSFGIPERAIAKMQELKDYFRQKNLIYVEESELAYQWQFTVAAMPVWHTMQLFKTRNQIPGAFLQFLELASKNENYAYTAQPENTWQLRVTREEHVEEVEPIKSELGLCAEGFLSEDLAKQAIVSYTEKNNYLWLWLNQTIKEEVAGSYIFFDAKTGDSEILLKTSVLISDSDSGSDMLTNMLILAGNKDNLIIAPSPGEDGCLYLLQLQNEFQQVLAVSGEMNKNEAEDLQTRIISLSTRRMLYWKKAEEETGYSIQFQNGDETLLNGLFVFYSRQEAMEKLVAWVFNYTPENFNTASVAGKGYGYTVQPAGEPVLGEMFHFATADERDKKMYDLKNTIESLLKQYGLKILETKQYFFTIRNEDGKTLLQEAECKQSPVEIQHDFYKTCRLGKEKGRYKKIDDCTFSFILLDEENNDLATHPVKYLSPAERDLALNKLIDFLNNHAPVTYIETLAGSWRYKWEWLSCSYAIETALESSEERNNEGEALEDMKLILQSAKEASFYKIIEKENELKSEFIIQLHEGANDSAELIASHPKLYNCRSKAEKIIDRMVNNARFNLSQGADFKTKLETDERLQAGANKKGMRLWDRAFRIANYYRLFSGREERDKVAKETWLHYKTHDPFFTTLEQANAIIKEDENNHQFFFNLTRNDGLTLWTSANGYDETDEAKVEFQKQYLKIIELSRDKSNYSNWETGSTTISLFEKKCGTGNQVLIATFRAAFSNAQDFAEAVRIRQEAAYLYPVYKDGKNYKFHLYRTDLKAYEWKGTNQYVSIDEAWNAFYIFLELLKSAANFGDTIYYKEGEERPGTQPYTISLCKVLFDINFDPNVNTAFYSGTSKNDSPGEIDLLKQFLSFISQDEQMFYRFTNYADRCRYGLRLVNHNRYKVARHTVWYESIRIREEQRKKLQASVNCDVNGTEWLDCPGECFEFPGLIDKEKIWSIPESLPTQQHWVFTAFKDEIGKTYYRYQLNETQEMMKGSNKCRVIWRSINRFIDKPDKEDNIDYCNGKTEEIFFYVELLELARSASSYVYEPIIGKGQRYHLFLKDTDGQIVAEAPEIICGDFTQDRNIRIINAMLYPIFRKEEGYSFEINKICQHKNSDGTFNYHYNTIWEGLQTFDNPDKAFDAYQHALTLLKDLRNYERNDHSPCGPFGIELVDPMQVLAVHPITYINNEQLLVAEKEIERAISSEGFHVLEHILLRPLQKTQTSSHLYANLTLYPATNGQEEVQFRINSQMPFESAGVFIKALQDAFTRKTIYTERTEESFSVSFWNTSQELLAGVQLPFSDKLPKKLVQSKKKIVKEGIDSEKVCGDIEKLLTRQLPVLSIADIHTASDCSCERKTGLLALCPEQDLCSALKQEAGLNSSCDLGFLADPYSFWATVVVPSWPRRFLLPRFRELFEKKLRYEAPAHVRLRIVWVSPADMHLFEDAYGKWLQALTRKEGCDYQSSLNKLTAVLMQIRNEYPEAHLFSDEGQQGLTAVLDEIILG